MSWPVPRSTTSPAPRGSRRVRSPSRSPSVPAAPPHPPRPPSRARVAARLRERLPEPARELGWTARPRARALSVQRALAVGLVVARTPETLRADAFFPTFIAGLESALSERGYALLLQVTPRHD